MMKDFQNIAMLLLVLMSCVLNAQRDTTILEHITAHYKNRDSYHFKMDYKMYRGFTGNELTEAYAGSLHKNGSVSFMQMLDAKVWIYPEAQITIHEPSKTIYITKNLSNTILSSPIDMAKGYAQFYNETKTELNGNSSRYELNAKNNALSLPYGRIVLYIDNTSLDLKKQEFYFASKMPFVDAKGKHVSDYGRLEIVYEISKAPIEQLALNDIVITKNNNFQLTKQFQGYQLIDKTKYAE